MYLLDACKKYISVPGKDGLVNYIVKTKDDSMKLKVGLSDFKEKGFNIMTC